MIPPDEVGLIAAEEMISTDAMRETELRGHLILAREPTTTVGAKADHLQHARRLLRELGYPVTEF